jgi:hypothetical protein
LFLQTGDIMITALVAFYLGGITTLLVGEWDSPISGGLQVTDVIAAVAWPVSAVAVLVTKINDYRKGIV